MFNNTAVALFEEDCQAVKMEIDRLREHSRELLALAQQLGFPLYLGAGKFLQGYALVESGDGDAGFAESQGAAARESAA